MVRAGQSSERAALIYQHSTLERQREVAAGIEARVLADRQAAEQRRNGETGKATGTQRHETNKKD